MSRVYRATTDDYEIFPAGTTGTVLTGIHFVGRHDREWQGQHSTADLAVLVHTAPGAGADGRDLSALEVVTVSFGPKAKLAARMRAYLQGREPRDGMELRELLGKAALIEVQHKDYEGTTRARVINATPLPRGMAPPKWDQPFDYTDVDDPDLQPDPDTVPALVRRLLETRIKPEPKKEPKPGGKPDFDDDIPW